MRLICLLVLMAILPAGSSPGQEAVIRYGLSAPPPRIDDAIRVASYNLLNLFDPVYGFATEQEAQAKADALGMSGSPTVHEMPPDAEHTGPRWMLGSSHEIWQKLGIGPTSDARCRAIAAAIRALDADVVCVQELESRDCLEWFNSTYLRDDEGVLLYPYWAAKDAGYYRDVEQGVLSRLPITSTRTFVGTDLTSLERHGVGWDSVPENIDSIGFQRSPLLVDISHPGGWDLSLVVLHHKAGRSDWHREYEALGVLDIVEDLAREDPHRNIAILGDLNTQPYGKSLRLYQEAGFVDTMAHRSTNPLYHPDAYLYATHDDGRVLDYILLNPAAYAEFIPGSCFVLGTHSPADYDWRTDEIPAGYASDHFPLAVSFLPREGQGASITAPPWSDASMAAALAAAKGPGSESTEHSIAPEGAPFIASRRSEVFHASACSNGKRIKDANKVGYAAARDAVAEGRRPASCCAEQIDSVSAEGTDQDTPAASFVGSSSSEVFHRVDCHSARRIKESNRVEYASIEDARSDGRRPAECCRPGP